MKNAKKLLLLLLSLAMLCGVFAVAALAEASESAATVVYPDGSVDTVNVGDAIVPKEFTDGLYYGKDNTLFKDDATEGWSFTLDGAALSDLTVTDAMAGKKIIAGGADKVYYTSEEIATDDSSKIVYHLVSDVEKYFSTSNTGDRGDGTNTGASHYKDLRAYPDGTEGRNTVKDIVVKLYEDVDVAGFAMNWFIDQASRKSGRNAYLDLNGHSVVNRTTDAYVEVKALSMRLYSSQPGAHWYQPNSATAFYVSDDATLVLGNNSTNTSEYSDNLSVHCKVLFNIMYGSGAYIAGGHYYQLEGATSSFVDISRRFYLLQNASFYVQDENAVFNTPYGLSDNVKKATNCKLYSTGESLILSGDKSAVLALAGCELYGIDTEVSQTVAKLTLDDACKTEATADFKTVTFFDGTTQKYLAASLEEAKAFVETHPLFAPAGVSEIHDGNELSVIFDPVYTATYDADFNATVTRGGEVVKVYYTVTYADGTVEYYTGADYQTALKTVFGAWPSGATVTLYADYSIVNGSVVSAVSGGKAYFDLNGHTWSLSGTGSPVFDIGPTSGKSVEFYCYSSTPGGKISAPSATYFTRTNSYGTGIFGERSVSETKYGKNLTVECKLFNHDLYGSGIGIYGGTYVQLATSGHNFFICASRQNSSGSQFRAIHNATFVLNKPNSMAIHWVDGGNKSILNCTFISNVSGCTAIGNGSTKGTLSSSAPGFVNCNFVNTLPAADLGNGKILSYQDCRFSLRTASTDGFAVKIGDATETKYLAGIKATETIFVLGEEYPVNFDFVNAGEYLTVEWTDETHPYWALGSSPISITGLEDIIEKQADGKYVVVCDRFYVPTGVTEVTEDLLGATVTTLETLAGKSLAIAFSYQVAGGNTQYAPLLATPTENGAQFFELLNDLSNLKIVMYTDIELSSGVLFGTLTDYTDPKGKVVKGIATSGDVDWDLNGFTVTAIKGATPIPMVMWKESQGAQTENVMHFVGNATFKLYSSVPGGQYINNSGYSLLGNHKDTELESSYVIGNGTDNLTIVSNGAFIASYETQAAGPRGVAFEVSGGTFVYTGTQVAFNLANKSVIKNATVLLGEDVDAFVSNHYYRAANLTVENSTIVMEGPGTKFIRQGMVGWINTNTPTTHVILVKDCAVLGGDVTFGYDKTYEKLTYTVEGELVASDEETMALYYKTAPEGKALAYSSIEVYGNYYKTLAYYEAPTTVTVKNELANITENWLVGSVHVLSGDVSALNTVMVDGKLHYRPNPVWTATLDGAVITDICAAENAGKTVLLNVGGETIPVIFTATISGVITYYTNAETAGADFKALLTPKASTTYELKLYSDIDTPIQTFGVEGITATYKLDANGYTLRFRKTTADKAAYALFSNSHVYFYSSVPGGAFDFGECREMACCDKSGHGYFGEPVNDGSTTYGKNVTFYFDALHGYMYSTGLVFNGGTYVQVENPVSKEMFNGTNLSYPTVIRNCTFVFKKVANAIFYGASFGNGNKIENCTFICEEPTNLFLPVAAKDKATTFQNCNFYNVIPNLLGVTVTYDNCAFGQPSSIEQAGGYIAGTATDVIIEVLGEEYAFCAKLLPIDQLTAIKAGATEVVYWETASFAEAFAQGKFVTVDWGFGLGTEYWAIGATATHENVTVEGMFVYAYAPFTVGNANCTAEATLVSVVSGSILMDLKLENDITFRIYVPKSAGFVKASMAGVITVLDESAATDGDYYVIGVTFSPSHANESFEIALEGTYSHSITADLAAYANAVLADDTKASAHNLTYAVVEYVALMADADIAVEAPAGYVAQALVAAPSENIKDGNLSMFALCHDEVITLALTGTVGTQVVIAYANGEVANATVGADGTATVTLGDVSLLAGDITFTAGEEVYTYNLANYLNGQTNELVIAKLKALYNYAYYADQYVIG